jgi:hypothetical protein
MQGDLIDWAYQLQQEWFPAVNYTGTAIELGTYGEGILAGIASLRTMNFEN